MSFASQTTDIEWQRIIRDAALNHAKRCVEVMAAELNKPQPNQPLVNVLRGTVDRIVCEGIAPDFPELDEYYALCVAYDLK